MGEALSLMYTENLIGQGGFMVLEPADTRKCKLRLSRTLIEMNLGQGGTFRKTPCFINLKGIKASSRYQLELCQKNKTLPPYYEMRSLGQYPFLHNGVPSYHSILRVNDVIDIEYNRLIFKPELIGSPIGDANEIPLESWPQEMFIHLEGETGVGKSTLAKKIHNKFLGETAPFIHINLSAFSEGLLESELFGHEKGAFTGAITGKRGAIERSSKGTLFIDEIDSLPIHLQIKLLTFLDNGEYQSVGGERIKKATSRFIFASGTPLKQLLQEERLRKDFFFRLTSGFCFSMKPLRACPAKVKEIIKEVEVEKSVIFSKDLIDYYIQRQWPGNIRQLKAHLLRKIYENLKISFIRLSELDEELIESDFHSAWNNENTLSLSEIKAKYCQRVLMKSSGSIGIAAKKLGISTRTLRRLAS